MKLISAVRLRPARTSSNGHASAGDARPDNRLALLDQAFYAGHRAAGQKEAMQVGWVYEHAIDFDGLRRFHHNLGYGLLGRLIERSPLPFARHRWVLDRGPSDIDIAKCARPRAELSDWFEECSQLPVDPESGPGWYLGVLPLTDGSTAITLLMSHNVLDGIGGAIEVAKAAMGYTQDFGYPPPRSHTRLRAVVRDARQAARDAPEVGRALVAAVKVFRGRRHDAPRKSPASPPVTLGDDVADPVIVPGIWIHIDMDDWDARAQTLGGASNTLAAGLTARLGEHLGRRHADDGTVTMQLVVSDRAEGDTRAVAVSFARVSIDPTQVTTDLRDARAAVKQALKTLRETPDESSLLAPLTPFTPKRMWKQLVDEVVTDPDFPAVCSILGDIGLEVTRPDGTQCEYGYARGLSQHLTRQSLEQMGGELRLLYMRLPALGKVSISVQAYRPGAENTKPALRELAARTLAEFGLAGEIE
jgi:hypothetical protein